MSGRRFPVEFTGRIVAALPVRQGRTADGREWSVAEYVMSDEDPQYEHKIVFAVSAGKATQLRLQVGEVLTVYLDFHAKEVAGGRWYNSVRAYNALRQPQQPQQPQQPPLPQQPGQGGQWTGQQGNVQYWNGGR